MIHVKTPNAEQLAYIKKLSTDDARKCIRQRAMILLLGWDGRTPTHITAKLRCSRNTVYYWLTKWNTEGIGPVVTWRQTDRWRHRVNRRRALAKLVTTSPAQLQLPFSSWSVVRLAMFLTDLVEYPISSTTIWRDLRGLGLSYKKIQDTFWLKPVDYDLKKAWLRFFERFCPPSCRIIYVDEKGPVHALRHTGQCWSWKRQFRDVRQASYGKVRFLGAFDPGDYQLEMFPMADGTSYSFRQALDLVRMTFLTEGYTELLLIMDNNAAHHAHATLAYFEADPQLDFFFLPTYSPELNPIELCFRHYTTEFLNNGSFESVTDLIEGTEAYCSYYKTFRREIYAN